ncbi:MAG: nucleotidyl transferase AbiEii/AbiGii toxin family protein [Bacteroidales bacterium]|nr:nucleotidyl transferase AbiEii/AbiGii toxin family protein [Bacteroidales bacterium]
MLQYQTIYPATLQLLKDLQLLELLKECRLVGGTALALQLGHRRSVDLDFFGTVPQTPDELQDLLRENHDVTIVKESKNIHIYLIDGVKVDIVNYKYDWIDTPVEEDGIRLADVKDIAAMKVAAIIGRGTKKDFIDMNRLLQIFSLKEILDMYMQKYPDGSLFIAIKSLSYFEDAESDPMPFMFDDTDWGVVKANIREAIAGV